MAEEFNGIKLEIVLPSDVEITQKIKQLQNRISGYKLNIDLNLKPETLKGLERLGQLSESTARQLRNIKAPKFDLANPNKEAQLYLDRINALVIGLKRFNGSVVETHDALGRVNLQVQTADGILKKYTLQWDSAKNALRQTNRQDTDKSDIIREQQLQEAQKIKTKLEQDFQRQIQQNLTTVKNYYNEQQQQIQKNIELRQKQIAQIKDELLSQKDIAHWLDIQKQNFESSTIKFAKNRTGLYDPAELDNLKQKFAALDPTMGNVKQQVQSLKAEFARLDANAVAKGLNNAHHSAMSFSESITTAAYKMGIWLGVGNLIFGVIASFKQGIQTVNDLNKAMTNIAMITGRSQEEIQGMTQEYVKLASALHDTTSSIMQASEEFLRAGHNQAETLELIKSSTVMSKIAGQDQKATAEQLIAITNAYKMNIEDTMSVVDKLTTVDNASATSTAELGTALERTSSSAQMAGVSFDKLVSYIATVSSVSRKSASSIGESFKTIFARFQDVKGGKNFDIDNEDISNVERDLRKYADIDIRSDVNTFKEFGVVIDELAKKWNNLGEAQQSGIAKALAGTRQRENFLVLMNNYNQALDLENKQLNASGSALTRYGEYAKSTEAKLNDLTNAFQKMWMHTLNSSAINAFIGAMTKMVNFVDEIGVLSTSIIGLNLALAALGKMGVVNEMILKLISSFKALTVTTITLEGVLSTFWPLLAVGAVVGLAKVFDSLTTSLSEQRQKVADLTQGYNTLQDQIKQLRTIKNPNEEQTKYLQLLEKELALKQRILNIEKIKLAEKEVNGGGFGQGGGLSQEVAIAQKQLEDTLRYKKVLEERIKNLEKNNSPAQLVDNSAYQKSIEGLKNVNEWANKLELSLLEDKKKLQSYVDTLGKDAPEGTKKLINQIDNLIPKVEKLNGGLQKGAEHKQKDLSNLYNQNDIDAVISKNKELNESEGKLFDSFQKLSSTVADYNNLLNDVTNGKKLDAKATMDLVQKYPELINAIKIEHGNVIVNKQAIEDLRKAKINEFQSTMMAQAGMTQAQVKQLKARLKNYGIEISAIQSVADAMRALTQAQVKIENTKYTDMGVRTKQLESVRATMSQYVSVLQYRSKINSLIGAVSSPGYGVGGSGGSKSGGGSGSSGNSLKEDIKNFKSLLSEAKKEYIDFKYTLAQQVKFGAITAVENVQSKLQEQESFVKKLIDLQIDLNEQLTEWQNKQKKYKTGSSDWKSVQTVINKIKTDIKQIPNDIKAQSTALATVKKYYDSLVKPVELLAEKIKDSVDKIRELRSTYVNTIKEINIKMGLGNQFKTDIFGTNFDFFEQALSAQQEFITQWESAKNDILKTAGERGARFIDLTYQKAHNTLSEYEKAELEILSTTEDIQKVLKDNKMTTDDIVNATKAFASTLSNYNLLKNTTELIQKLTEKVQSLGDELKTFAADKSFETKMDEIYGKYTKLFDTPLPTDGLERNKAELEKTLDGYKDKINELVEEAKKLEQMKLDIKTGDFTKKLTDQKTAIQKAIDDILNSSSLYKSVNSYSDVWSKGVFNKDNIKNALSDLSKQFPTIASRIKPFLDELNKGVKDPADYLERLKTLMTNSLRWSSFSSEQITTYRTLRDELVEINKSIDSVSDTSKNINADLSSVNSELEKMPDLVKETQDELNKINRELEVTSKLKDVFKNVFSFDSLFKDSTDEYGNQIKTLNDQIVKTLQSSSELADKIFTEMKTKMSETLVDMITSDDGFIDKLLNDGNFLTGIGSTFDELTVKWQSTLNNLGSQASTYFSGSFTKEILAGFGNIDGVLGQLIQASLDSVPKVVTGVMQKLPAMFNELNQTLLIASTNSITTVLNQAIKTISNALRLDLPTIELMSPTVTKIENTETQVYNASQPTNITYVYNINGILLYREGALRELAYAIKDVLQEDAQAAW